VKSLRLSLLFFAKAVKQQFIKTIKNRGIMGFI
jgi:hypothetical protein